jgi:hypothetical protein
MENKEIWKDIVGWEGLYIVSNLGNIRSLDRKVASGRPGEGRLMKGKERKPLLNKGYLSINLIDKKTGKSTRNSVHRFVAEAFIPNPDNKLTVNHIDGNKSNNTISNLEWATYSENAAHAIKTGLKKNFKMTDEQKKHLSIIAKKRSKEGNCSLRKWQKNNKSKVVEMALLASKIAAKKAIERKLHNV